MSIEENMDMKSAWESRVLITLLIVVGTALTIAGWDLLENAWEWTPLKISLFFLGIILVLIGAFNINKK